ncbi:MAG TPA: peptide chain release factor N(5)-glutamine methyltransferase [Roseiflexaceae bacterium]|nr:peptide chain release factor N(5)-glutamine methyltransferase [Roseiflexaceae bacterium]
MTTTIAEALADATAALRPSSSTPRLDAELLLAHALGWPRARLLAEGRATLPATARDTFRALVRRRAGLEPVAYLVGRREFYGLEFAVDCRVLVPRPETELLVELALGFARRTMNDEHPATNDAEGSNRSSFVVRRSPFVIADIGTGSGCIAVALAVHLPRARVYATDISLDALAVARANAERHGVAGRVTLLQGDLLAPLPEPVDLLVSNPPYTVLAQVDEGVRRHEPRLALDGGPDGLALYRRLLADAPGRLRSGGVVLLEIGAEQGRAVAALARAAFPGADVRVQQDLAGHDRAVVVDTRPDGER